ncbi:MAG: LysR family transcriptional regulator [Phyllobacteriaceae bacterium]|nr:LysR family transcriptional regulator [Phyllobacteriaceae bacterium]
MTFCIPKPTTRNAKPNQLPLRDFRLILAIHEAGQLALAAEKLALTQPAASRLLAGIEVAIGAPLFVRKPKGMSATPVGEILARNAVNLFNGLEQTMREVDAAGSGVAAERPRRSGDWRGRFVVAGHPTFQAERHWRRHPFDVAPATRVDGGLQNTRRL